MTITTTLATDAIEQFFMNAATTFEFDHVSIDSRSFTKWHKYFVFSV